MVDFQSRSRRTRETDDEDEEEESTAADASGTDEEPEEAETTTEETSTPSYPVAGVAVVTVADDLTIEDDDAGDAVVDALGDHEVVTRDLLGRNHDSVQGAVDALVSRGDVDAVVTVGATGVSQRDITIEAVHPLFQKALPGFGELFRRHYEDVVGSDVITTRATAGIAQETPVFCLPGSPEAARLGVEEIVAEQAGRLTAEGL